MQVDFGLALLIARCLMLFAITITLGIYYDPSARRRWVVSIGAACAAGVALSWGLFSAIQVAHHAIKPSPWHEIWPTLFVLCAMVPVLYTRGNVAKLLPRVKWLIDRS